MNEVPELKNAAKVLADPDSPESKLALEAYRADKRPAEDLRRKQREWMRERHGDH